MASIIDANVLVELAQNDRLEELRVLDEPRLVPDIVDDEMQKGQVKYAVQYARYAAAVASGLLEVRVLIGTLAYDEYLRLRRTRTSPGHNRGEDACIALAITVPGSVVYTNETRVAKAKTELGAPSRVRSFP